MVRPKWPSQFAWAFWHRKGGTPPTPPTPEGIVLADTETQAKTYSPATMEWEVFNNTKYPVFMQTYNTSGKEIYADIIGADDTYSIQKAVFSKDSAGNIVLSPSGYKPTAPETGKTWTFKIDGGQEVLAQVYSTDASIGMLFPDIIQKDGVVTMRFSIESTGWPVLIKSVAGMDFVASTEWVFQHNLGRRVLAQAYIDEVGQAMGEVVYVDKDTVKMLFSEPKTGRMVVA